MKKAKVFRGTIKSWQLHHLSTPQDLIDKVYPGGTPVVFTGTVVSDPSGKRSANDHMRSSLITKINSAENTIETVNSYYQMAGKEGGDIFEDMGDSVLNIFY